MLKPNKSQFKKHHVDSLLDMMRKVKDSEEGSTKSKDAIIEAVKSEFSE